MWKTALFLIFALLIVPYVAFSIDEPLTELQFSTLKTLFWIYIATASACFLLGEITKNYSQTDKVWSISPAIYAWVATAAGDWDMRMVLMSIIVTIWAIRLSYNFNRAGGYSWKFWTGKEDYRWAILRKKPGFEKDWVWSLFNLLFISFYQNGLILLFTLPIILVMGSEIEVGFWDGLVAGLMVAWIAVEYKADQEHWEFQSEKYRRINAGKNLTGGYAKGFLDTGLWAKIRHPNYMAEQAVWITFYFFSVVATGQWINWSIAGCLLLVLLFKGSSDFSESISASKYPEYKEYQKRAGRFFPKLF